MRIQHLAIGSTVALVIAACSGGAAETTTAAPAPTTATTAAPSTTIAPTTTVPPKTTTTLPPVPERLAFLGGPDTAEFTEKVVTVIHRPGVIDRRVTTTVEGRFSAPSDYAYTVRTGAGAYSEASEIVTLGFDHWVLEEHKQWRSADTWDIWYRSFHSEHGLASSDIDLEEAYELLADTEYEIEVRNGLDVRVYELGDEALESVIDWGDFSGDYFEGAATDTAATMWISDTTYDLLELSLFTNLDVGMVEGVDEGTTAEITLTLVIDSINETIAEITEPDVPVYADVPDGFLPYSDPAVGIDFVYPEDWMISLDDDSFYFYGEPVVNFFDGLTGNDVTLEMLDLSRFAGMPLDEVVEFFDDEFIDAGLERISRDAVAIADRDGVSSKWETVVDDMVVYFELSLAFDGERALVMISTVDEFSMPYVGRQLEALVDSIELSEPSESVAG